MSVAREDPLSAVLELIASDAGSRAERMADFARSYLQRLSPDGITSAEALYHEVAGLYRLIETKEGPFAVRVFNPAVDSHGYETAGAVVEVHIDDCPFLVDSIVGEIRSRGLGVATVLHPVIGTERDEAGRLIELTSARAATRRESVQHYVLDRTLTEPELAELEAALAGVLGDVQLAVGEFPAMLERIPHMVELARRGEGLYPAEEVEETVAFLEWLLQDNFVFLGYREYRLFDAEGGRAVQRVADSGLGILSKADDSELSRPVLLSSLPPELASSYEKGDLLVITKTNRPATVHRRARMDYVGVRIMGEDGISEGEARMLGLFTSKAYSERASRTPVLRGKLEHIARTEELIEGSHDHKAVVELFESFPKDELFGVPAEDLRRLMMGLLALLDRPRVRLFARREPLDRSIRLLVAMPRDRYSGSLARSLQRLFMGEFGAKAVDYHLNLGVAGLAQLHFRVWVEEEHVPHVDLRQLDAQIQELARSWSDRVADLLRARHGPDRARLLVDRWAPRFPTHYAASTELSVAVGDIEHLDDLIESEEELGVGLQNEGNGGQPLTRVALYGRDRIRELSELTPALEDLGMRVVEETATRLSGEGGLYIHDFGVLGPDGKQLDLSDCGARTTEVLTAVWNGEAETDSLNRLVLVGGLDRRQLDILRAYRTYWRRVAPTFTVRYVNDTLVSHAGITAMLMRLFQLRFGPGGDQGFEELRYEVSARLDEIPSLDEDRILRGFLHLIEATVRTNAYRAGTQTLSFKLRSADVPNMPRPVPHMEIFVIGPEVEGIHLRAGPVARGGIRWSDRREDYRTEVLGLLKAQVTKNAAIVPTGAKGGFVLRHPPSDPTELIASAMAGYRAFIGGLLDVTDNLVDGEVSHPDGVRVRDGHDPYLVVAPDRGTAAFSDIANDLARRRGFWLGDAFASGGATGYDHKALGITARGAWKSLERHLLDAGVDPGRDRFTVVGIGDMSGDVFGNGMLLSENMALIGAFDHRHIFLDPDPDPAASFAERRRLFDLDASTWADYDPRLISEGGGVYPRTAKQISLSPQARRVLDTEAETATPADLIRMILAAPVDVLWNGGIGTYVKASTEANESVGDRDNDPLRINGSDLRCRVVVEGGNLGLTQAGRIEYAESGGRINTDFIDNSGGVNCSDREVNLKILLHLAQDRDEIERPERDRLMAESSDDVVAMVLQDSLEQTQLLGLEESTSAQRMDAYEQLMTSLEEEGMLERGLEGLPSSEQMAERARSRRGLSRPEMAVLVAYAKHSLVESLLASDLPVSPDLDPDLAYYFPSRLSERFGHLIPQHPLRRELAATMVANAVVNAQGSTFVSRLVARTGAQAADVVRCYRIANRVSGGESRSRTLEDLAGTVEPGVWTSMLGINARLLASLTRWYLKREAHVDEDDLRRWAEGFTLLEDEMSRLTPPQRQADRAALAEQYETAGVPPALAHRVAFLPHLIHAPNILELAEETGRKTDELGQLFFRLGQAVQLDTLEKTMDAMTTSDPWRRWALQTIEDNLVAARRRIAQRVLTAGGDTPGEEAVDAYLAERAHALARLGRLVQRLPSQPGDDLAPLLVAVSQVEAL